MDLNRQAPTGREEQLGPEDLSEPLSDDQLDAEWDRLGGDPEAAYLDDGEPAGRPAEGDRAPAMQSAPLDVDFAAMRPEQRVETMREITGNPDLDPGTALALADGFMRNKHYTEGRMDLADERRAVNALLRQYGVQVPEGQTVRGFLESGQLPTPTFAPFAPQAPMPPQPTQPFAPPQMIAQQTASNGEPTDLYDTAGFIEWFRRNNDGRDPDMGDYNRWKDSKLMGGVNAQLAQEQTARTVQGLKSEWEQVTTQFPHATEPGVSDRVEAELIRRAQGGIPLYPGMVREIYLGLYGQEAMARQALAAPRRQAPPVPPASPGGSARRAQPERLTTSEAILEKQLRDAALLSELEGSLTGEESVYERPATPRRRR